MLADASQQQLIAQLTTEAQAISGEATALQQRLLQSRNTHNNTRMQLHQLNQEITAMQDTTRVSIYTTLQIRILLVSH